MMNCITAVALDIAILFCIFEFTFLIFSYLLSVFYCGHVIGACLHAVTHILSRLCSCISKLGCCFTQKHELLFPVFVVKLRRSVVAAGEKQATAEYRISKRYKRRLNLCLWHLDPQEFNSNLSSQVSLVYIKSNHDSKNKQTKKIRFFTLVLEARVKPCGVVMSLLSLFLCCLGPSTIT